MYRDFSEASKNKLLGLVADVENEKLCNFTDWVGDRWLDFEYWIGSLDLKKSLNNVNSYHKKVIDKNNTSSGAIERIFTRVRQVDGTYEDVFGNVLSLVDKWDSYINQLSDIINPANGKYSAQYMHNNLRNLLDDIESDQIKCLRDRMVQNINGELIFDEELIYEYIKKNPSQMTDAEQKLVLEVIAQLKDTVATYESLAKFGDDEIGVDLLNKASWVSETTKYDSFSAISAHYNQLYINILEYISEQSEDENTFAASLLTVGIGDAALNLLGVETYENLKDIFGSDSIKAYIAKYKTEHSETYFLKLEASEKDKLSSSGKFRNFNDWMEDKLKEKGLFDKDKKRKYFDKYGNEIDEKDAPDFYKRQLTLAEISKSINASASLYNGNFDIGEDGSLAVAVGEAEAYAGFSGGFYVIGSDGERKFSPGVKAEVGVSVTAFEAEWEQQWLGDENLGLNSDVKVTAGQASAKADATAQVFGADGKLDMQFGAGVSAEAIGGEVEGSIGLNVLGGEVGVKGSVNYGVGAHADVGYRDGVFKCEVGASLGLGVSVGFEVDVGGMVDTVVDTASSAWEGVKSGWNNFWDKW